MKRCAKHGSRRRFSETFKIERVKEYDAGKITVGEISRLYKVTPAAVYKWLKKYSYLYEKGFIVVEHSNSYTEQLKERERRISSLEKLVGQKQISIDYLEQVITEASEHFGIDLKKSFVTKPLNQSE